MTWEHITPIHTNDIGADIDCSDTQYPAKFAAVADFDGDGRAEVLVAPHAGGSRGNDLWVMKFDEGFGSWEHMAQLDDEMQADIDCSDSQYPAKFAVVADFDGDGRAEVLVAPDANDPRGNDLWVMKYVGTYPDGSFQHMALIPNQQDPKMEADIDCSDTAYPAKFAVVADFDGDGRAEVLVAPDADVSRGNDLWVMKYVGDYPDGSFQHMAQLDDEMQADIDCSDTPYPAKFAVVADFDGDGRAEVLVAPDADVSRGNDLWVMKYVGDYPGGSFQHMAQLDDEMQADIDCSDTPYPAKFAVVADFDADGRPEVLVAPDANDSRGNDLWVLGFRRSGSLNPILPNVPSPDATADITLRFASTTNNLYAGILDPHSTDLNLLRTDNYLGATDMTVLVPAPGNTTPQADQPYLEAISQTDSTGHATDRVYVGNEDVTRRDSHQSPTAAVDLSQDATGTPPAGFQHDLIAQRSGILRNGPSVRPIVHPDGTVYAATHEWTEVASTDGTIVTADVVVVRDDDWGASPKPFTALIDPGDYAVGVRVVTGRTGRFSQPPTFGQERVGLNLSIAVDPRTSDVVYLAWAELSPTKDFDLHVRRSGDRGATWSEDLHVVTNARIPPSRSTTGGKSPFSTRR